MQSSYPSRDDAAPKRLGRYELLGQLATGGMAEIHLARLAGEGGFEKIVVVKRLLPELVASPAYVAMFLDEGKLVARLDHPNICEVHELGRDGAEYYLAMPYLDGVAVHELIARPRDPDRIAQLRVATGVIAQACAGLHHAHELRDADGAPAGLVHRDVSPSNLFVTAAGIVKVLDFGVAKVRGATETEVGTIKGKQQYMAPEQLLGESLDRRCDVFALGIVLFELATHQRLFKRASDYLTAKAVLEEPVPRADAVDPAVPAPLADVIARALAREPKHRYATAAELGAAIEAAMAPHGGIGGPSVIAATVNATDELSAMRTRQARVIGEAKSRVADDTKVDAAPTTPMRAPPTTRDAHPSRSRMMWAGAAAAAIATTAVVVVIAMRGGGSPTGAGRTSAATRDATSAASLDETSAATRDGSSVANRYGSSAVNRDGTAVVAHDGTGTTNRDGISAADRDGTSANGASTTAATSRDGSPATNRDGSSTAADAAARGGSSAATRGGSSAAPEIEMPSDRARPAKPGLFSIDSTPWATIYIDGARLGITPIVKRSLPAGRHKLRAVLEDGRSKEMSIQIRAGKLAKPIQLTW